MLGTRVSKLHYQFDSCKYVMGAGSAVLAPGVGSPALLPWTQIDFTAPSGALVTVGFWGVNRRSCPLAFK